MLWPHCKVADRRRERLLGIMLQKKLREPLLIPFEREGRKANAIHSFFCLVPFDAVFLNSAGRVVDIRKSIPPFQPLIVPAKPAAAVLETPAGECKRVKMGDKLQFKR
jgi:uncharacterized membrane protein (UPF0127 family)